MTRIFNHFFSFFISILEEANFWMYAMIVLGLAFIVFVAITIYKLCQPEKDGRSLKQQRSGSVPGTMTVGPPPTTIVS